MCDKHRRVDATGIKTKQVQLSLFQGLVDTVANLQPIDVAVDFRTLHVPEHTFFILCITGEHEVVNQEFA